MNRINTAYSPRDSEPFPELLPPTLFVTPDANQPGPPWHNRLQFTPEVKI